MIPVCFLSPAEIRALPPDARLSFGRALELIGLARAGEPTAAGQADCMTHLDECRRTVERLLDRTDISDVIKTTLRQAHILATSLMRVEQQRRGATS
jgi:hypothetical protein